MSAPKDGGPAFPRPVAHAERRYREDQPHYSEPQSGMTLRDWFAGQALVGTMASDTEGWKMSATDRARYCYHQADEMLAERERTP